jgi:hypothetical protein
VVSQQDCLYEWLCSHFIAGHNLRHRTFTLYGKSTLKDRAHCYLGICGIERDYSVKAQAPQICEQLGFEKHDCLKGLRRKLLQYTEEGYC